MKTTAKKRSKLLPAIAMLTVSAIMLTTATYAWFTMNKEASVTGIEMTATTPSSIEISLGQIKNDNSTYSIEAPSTDDHWKNTVDFGDFYSTVGKLKPSSSVTGFESSYFAATNAITAGTSDKFAAATGASPMRIKGDATATELNSGYYMDIPIWLRTRGEKPATLTLNGETSSIKLKDTSADKLAKAIRVAFLNEGKTAAPIADTANMWNPNAGAYNDSGAVQTVAADNTATFKAPTFLTTSTTADSTGATTLVNLKAGTQTGAGEAVKIYVRIWIEGQDTSCVNKNAGAEFVGSLNFLNIADVNS